jgi:hypothetical protein
VHVATGVEIADKVAPAAAANPVIGFAVEAHLELRRIWLSEQQQRRHVDKLRGDTLRRQPNYRHLLPANIPKK